MLTSSSPPDPAIDATFEARINAGDTIEPKDWMRTDTAINWFG